ncbi:hypothetical protein HDU98_004558, partial [Podochytrium sp. JEL0797]
MSIALPGTYTLADTKCTGSVITSSNLVKPWDDGCLTSFTLTQSAIDANTGNDGSDAIFGAVFNTPRGLSCGADDIKSRLTQYFPPNSVQAWTGVAVAVITESQNKANESAVVLGCSAAFGPRNPDTKVTPLCGAVWMLEGGVPAKGV